MLAQRERHARCRNGGWLSRSAQLCDGEARCSCDQLSLELRWPHNRRSLRRQVKSRHEQD